MKHLYKNIRLALTLAAALAGMPAALAGGTGRDGTGGAVV